MRAILRKDNYVGTLRAFALAHRPVEFMLRYIRNGGDYPVEIRVRSPTGRLSIRAYAPDDIQTINEIFFRGDYAVPGENRVIVDFGSNIGISCIYFLSRTPGAFCYGFEPLPQNIERFKANLAPFVGRFELTETAVGIGTGPVTFGWEPTGRYGGIGRETGRSITVDCRDSNEELQRIVDKHGQIDVLKVDIETLEKVVIDRIPEALAKQINNVIVEYVFKANPLSATHQMFVGPTTTRFRRL
jgi:FkbM family methyltransferase